MKRARICALLSLVGILTGCYEQSTNRAVPVTVVNDACGANATQAACVSADGCAWRAVKSDCPAGATCPDGVCATPDPCAALSDRALCEADTRCAWAGVRAASQAIDLCPAGQACDTGGYCHTRDASGGGCTCVQPIACPPDADCPAVQCDCSKPPAPEISSGGGGTCTCSCPVCAPGETCAPCRCACGAAATCGGVTSASPSVTTCTCACPACAPGTTCAPCDCACGAGNVGVSNSGTTTPTMVGPAADVPTDPCAKHGDAATCAADSATACKWIELGIVCVTAPCPTGACVQVQPVPGAPGCGCACAACASGQSCPPCACDCCSRPAAGLGPVPVPS